MAKEIKKPKYIFVVGGVISGVGKGVTTSSIAKIMQNRGLEVSAIKIDPYVNVDAGTMNPTEHGEVFVLDSGLETDQDMGNYERFLNISLPEINYMTTGRVYQSVINDERHMKYKGKCVQVVPHVPLEVIRRIEAAQKESNADIVIIEVGGTVGEYETILYYEAARMLKAKDPDSVAIVMVSFLPIPKTVGEMKTKPTQHAVRTLNASGVQPDFIIARSKLKLDKRRKEKISFFCNIPSEQVISAPDINSIYDVPINFEKERMGDILCNKLKITNTKKNIKAETEWKKFAKRVHSVEKEVNIAVVGKYFETGDFVLSDAYLSVIEALKYSAYALGRKPVLHWLSSERFEDKKQLKSLKEYDGVLVPGGFGSRGTEGLINVIEYTRKNKIPYFGICYGMQLMVIEYARNMAGIKDATSPEIDPKGKNLVVNVMEAQEELVKQGHLGGTMRLGGYSAKIKKGTQADKAYGKSNIIERHRHRYEVSIDYIKQLEESGLIFSGTSPDGLLMEIAELPKKVHPFFLAAQFHPEFLARPLDPHPLFTAFIKASIKK
ncbi:CTP synthase [Candidatus Parcubacteria bacterium]|nr:CTP synthase [Candidatus Parcubacteria bacterium]